MVPGVYMLPMLHLLNHLASLRIERIHQDGMDILADNDEVGIRARLPIGRDKVLDSIDKSHLPASLSRDRIDVKDVTGSLSLFRKVETHLSGALALPCGAGAGDRFDYHGSSYSFYVKFERPGEAGMPVLRVDRLRL